MPNFLQYENKFVFTLPQETQDKIINYLNNLHYCKLDCWKREYYAESDIVRTHCREQYLRYKSMINVALRTLDLLEIHPVIGWAGHHDSYFFPTINDCEMQEDWYNSCEES